MSFNITEFKAAVQSGVARPNLYAVTIFFNKLPLFGQRQLRILCESAEIPGRRFDTTPELIYGVARKMPFGTVYEDLSLTFICTNRMEERYWFDRWMGFVCNPTSNYMHYFDDYKANILIEHYDQTGRVRYTCVVEEAYPIALLPQPLSYGDENNYLKLTVDFAYRRWRNDDEIEAARTDPGRSFTPRITGGNKTNPFQGPYNAPDNDTLIKQTDYNTDFADYQPGSFDRNTRVNPGTQITEDPVDAAAGVNASDGGNIQQTTPADSIGPGGRVDQLPGVIVPNETSNGLTLEDAGFTADGNFPTD